MHFVGPTNGKKKMSGFLGIRMDRRFHTPGMEQREVLKIIVSNHRKIIAKSLDLSVIGLLPHLT